MPILWRYLLGQYTKILVLSVVAFIAILLVTRLEDVAQFASLGAPIISVLLFILYQIPYILPIAIPISCLISSMLLYKKISHTHELTSLRAAGLSLRYIIAPVLLAGGFLVLANFYIVSELATHSHFSTKKMYNELKSINPLLLLQNPQLLKFKGAYIEILGPQQPGESAQDVLLAIKNHHNERIHVIIANKIESEPPFIKGENISIISNLTPKRQEDFDSLVVENVKYLSNPSIEFSYFMKKIGWDINDDHLNLRHLNIKLHQELSKPILTENSMSKIYKILSEISQRLSVALAAFTFTLMGTAFGIDIRRTTSKSKILSVITLAIIYLIAFFIAKGMEQHFTTATCLYFIPHVIIIILSIWSLKRVSRGVE